MGDTTDNFQDSDLGDFKEIKFTSPDLEAPSHSNLKYPRLAIRLWKMMQEGHQSVLNQSKDQLLVTGYNEENGLFIELADQKDSYLQFGVKPNEDNTALHIQMAILTNKSPTPEYGTVSLTATNQEELIDAFENLNTLIIENELTQRRLNQINHSIQDPKSKVSMEDFEDTPYQEALEEIQSKAVVDNPTTQSAASDTRNDLLAQIRAGKKLKQVQLEEKSLSNDYSNMFNSQTLKAAQFMQEDSIEEEENNEWDLDEGLTDFSFEAESTPSKPIDPSPDKKASVSKPLNPSVPKTSPPSPTVATSLPKTKDNVKPIYEEKKSQESVENKSSGLKSKSSSPPSKQAQSPNVRQKSKLSNFRKPSKAPVDSTQKKETSKPRKPRVKTNLASRNFQSLRNMWENMGKSQTTSPPIKRSKNSSQDRKRKGPRK